MINKNIVLVIFLSLVMITIINLLRINVQYNNSFQKNTDEKIQEFSDATIEHYVEYDYDGGL